MNRSETRASVLFLLGTSQGVQKKVPTALGSNCARILSRSESFASLALRNIPAVPSDGFNVDQCAQTKVPTRRLMKMRLR